MPALKFEVADAQTDHRLSFLLAEGAEPGVALRALAEACAGDFPAFSRKNLGNKFVQHVAARVLEKIPELVLEGLEPPDVSRCFKVRVDRGSEGSGPHFTVAVFDPPPAGRIVPKQTFLTFDEALARYGAEVS